MKQVLIATKKPFAPEARDQMQQEMVRAGLDVQILESYKDTREILEAVQSSHGLIVRSDHVDEALLDAASNLEIVIRAGAGYDTIDVEAAQSHGVIVENTPGQNANAVAELALELMLAALRPLSGRPGVELKDRVLGVHGLGNVGRLVASLGHAFGMQVKAFDVSGDTRWAREYGVTFCKSPEELYAGADVVSLHIPENDQTRQSISRDLLERMSDEALLVNTARAGVIHEADLLQLLKTRPGFRYASDVAPSKETLKLLQDGFADRIVLTPIKQGAQTREANLHAGMAAARQMAAFFTEGDTTFCVYRLIPPHLKDYAKLAFQIGKLNAAFVSSPRELVVISYGELNAHREALSEYVLKGLYRDVLGEDCTPAAAAAYAKEHHVRIDYPEPNNSKGYGNALTVDFLAGDGSSYGTRGRIDEGQLEASRIGEFKARMPLDPGLYVIASYQEGPGMADRAGSLLVDAGYNRPRLGAGPNIENSRALVFFQVEKDGLSKSGQLEELRQIASKMRIIPGVVDVKVINLA